MLEGPIPLNAPEVLRLGNPFGEPRSLTNGCPANGPAVRAAPACSMEEGNDGETEVEEMRFTLTRKILYSMGVIIQLSAITEFQLRCVFLWPANTVSPFTMAKVAKSLWASPNEWSRRRK